MIKINEQPRGPITISEYSEGDGWEILFEINGKFKLYEDTKLSEEKRFVGEFNTIYEALDTARSWT